MRVLVTGASGFVGPHAARALTDSGHEVWTTDRRAMESPRHRTCDLSEGERVQELVEEIRPEAVLHLASVSSVARSLQDPRSALLNNMTAACNLLEAVRDPPGTRVLLVGSAEQYGRVAPEDLPLRESQRFRPTSPYAVSKVAQEHLALQYHDTWGVDVVLTRSFNHAGPGQSPDFALPAFAQQIVDAERGDGESLLRVGNLEAERDFLDVRDVARAYALLLVRGERGCAYNVCSGVSHRLRDLVEAMVRRARVDVRIETDASRLRPADLPVLCGDPARLQQRTGWTRRYSMEQTLTDVLDDWRNRPA
jgi:GDP-4-dehydro-6-deoxy-D-mannose reductase